MLQPKLIAAGATLIVVCAIGSALTRHTHGAANVVSNVCFFTLALLVLAFAAAVAAAAIGRVRARR